MFDVVTFGSAVVDVRLDSCMPERGGKICFPVGDKIVVENINFSTGGGGTNTAASFSKLGLKVGFAGKLGDGMNAGIILRELKKEGVEFLGAQGDEHTGYSIVLCGKDGSRTILTHKGANNSLKFKDIKLSKLRTKWFYFSSLMEESYRTQERLVSWASKKGVKIAFNPSSYQVKQGARHLKHMLRKTDVLILNKDEARELVGGGNLLDGLRKLGPKIVCVTDGLNGNLVSDGVNVYEGGVNKGVKCVERTGAGDAFASGFVFGLVRNTENRKFSVPPTSKEQEVVGLGIEEAIQIGSANAESVIQKPGAKGGLLSFGEVKRIIGKRPVKIEIK